MSGKRDYELSLVNDCLRTKGVGIVDIFGFISHEFGDPVFKITRIALATGETVDVEGEHDMPYFAANDNLFIFPEADDADA